MKRRIAFGALLLCLIASAQEKRNPIVWRFGKLDGKPAPGATVRVTLLAQIAGGWHLYSLKNLEGGPIPTRIAVPPGQPFTLAGAVEPSEPIRLDDPVFGMEVEYYVDAAEFVVPIRLAADIKPGPQKLALTARFQTCNGTICLPPRTVTIEIPVEVLR